MVSRRDEGTATATATETTTAPEPPPQPDSNVPEMRGQGVHTKALRIRAIWSEIGRTPGCLACETPGPGKSHTRQCKTYQDAWDESRRTASAEEAKRGVAADPDTRPLDPSGSSMDPEPKRTKTTSVTDNNLGVGIAKFRGSLSKSFARSARLPVFRYTASEEADAIFLEFPTIAAGESPKAATFSKTCHDVPNEFRVSGCMRESRLINPLGLGILMG